MRSQSPFSQVSTYPASTETVSSSTSVYKVSATSTAVASAAPFHTPSMNQYGPSFSTYPGVDGTASGHTTAAAQYPSYAGSAAPGFTPQPQMGGSASGYGTAQASQPVYGGSAHLNSSSKPYGSSTTASDKQQSGITSYQSAGLSQSYDVYQQLNSGQLAAGGGGGGSGTSSGTGYPLSGAAYQTGQLTYQGSSFQQTSVPAGYDLSAASQLSGTNSYGSGHAYPPNLYQRQGRDNSATAGSYASGPDVTSVPGYPRGSQTYVGSAPSSSISAQSASTTANKLADGLGKLSVKDATSVTASGQFDSVQMTNSSTAVVSVSMTTSTASTVGVGFLPASTASSAAVRTTASMMPPKSSAAQTSKDVYEIIANFHKGPLLLSSSMEYGESYACQFGNRPFVCICFYMV